jgi:hypothetical protein
MVLPPWYGFSVFKKRATFPRDSRTIAIKKLKKGNLAVRIV